jgi:hypothetical protein
MIHHEAKLHAMWTRRHPCRWTTPFEAGVPYQLDDTRKFNVIDTWFHCMQSTWNTSRLLNTSLITIKTFTGHIHSNSGPGNSIEHIKSQDFDAYTANESL